MKKRLILVTALIFVVLSLSLVSAATFSNLGSNPSFQVSYESKQIKTYWPIIEQMEKGECTERKDIILNVAPFGCQPAVVRSDLLADQNVPVFCQIDALKINPLIEIGQIRNIRFTGTEYPEEVVGTGFHPARAALKSDNRNLIGSPLLSNIGYVVVVLKRNEVEASLPDFVEINLTAQIDYDGGNALGIGRAEFNLQTVSDEDWKAERDKQSFWNGKYYLRLNKADENEATISIYQGDHIVSSTTVKMGELSNEIYFPGSYCMASIKARYDGLNVVKTKARIEVSEGNGRDIFEVYKGSKFLNDKCVVRDIVASSAGTGYVDLRCGSELFKLEIKSSLDEAEVIKYAEENKGKEGIVGQIANIVWNKADVAKKGGEDAVEAILEFFRGAEFSADDERAFLEGYGELKDKEGDNQGINEVIASYEKVADEYPREKRIDIDISDYETIGEEALIRAIRFASSEELFRTEARLIRKLIKKYPNSILSEKYRRDLNNLYTLDKSKSANALNLDNRFVSVSVVDLVRPDNEPTVSLSIGGVSEDIKEEERKESGKDVFTVLDIDKAGVYEKDVKGERDGIKLGYRCDGEEDKTQILGVGGSTSLCGKVVRLNSINIDESANIKLIPTINNMGSESNLTVRIGIEKRAISLTPEKAQEKIDSLNKTIAKWESISEKLGKSVDSLQSACLATTAILTFKNFLTGMSGSSLARQKVMTGDNGWTNYCKNAVAKREYSSLNKCYLEKADEIEKDVKTTTDKLKEVNAKIKSIEKGSTLTSSILGKSIDQEKVKQELAKYVVDNHGDKIISLPEGKKINGAKEANVSVLLNNLDAVSFNELREIYLNLERQSTEDLTDIGGKNVNAYLASSAGRVIDNLGNIARSKAEDTENGYIPSAIYSRGGDLSAKNIFAEVVSIERVPASIKIELQIGSEKAQYSSVLRSTGTDQNDYYLGLEKLDGGLYRIVSAVSFGKQGGNVLAGNVVKDISSFMKGKGIGFIKSKADISYNKKMLNPEVKYYETEPYKGMPALVPIDKDRGWYVATKQTLPTFGGIGAFDASGRVTSFELCNVGDNGRAEVFEGYGDDHCQKIVLNTGMVNGQFEGLSEDETKALIQKGVKAITDAANQFGSKVVRIGSEVYNTGSPAANIPGTQCQDFMSPKECNLMFNLCDPVVCPPSRCNFGGKYNVPDVIQQGIIGGVLLCLPNIREGIYIPVCLTGIKAGIDGYLSVLKGQQQCYAENIKSGRMVGICDQMHSLYICDLFWKEIGPLANTLLPKLFEAMSGQGKRGGGEYLTVQSAWQNTKKSINQFTQSYGVNVAQAFKVTSLKEVIKSEACDAYVSTQVPDGFDSAMVNPDSPPQFHAWVSSFKHSDVTVPATSQYKVFYHIFAGNSQDVFFRVYLKSSQESSFYEIPETHTVNSGYISRGEFKSETKDFTAPEGYAELCVDVNGKEHCGFKQVSTNFAVNYLKDKYVQEQIEAKNIQSESECVSGKRTLGAALTLAGPQAMLEEGLISPESYNRGVVRRCATGNPGISTNPARWLEVGYCDDPKMICWLDQESVERAISDQNVGLKNETMRNLEKFTRENLEREGFLTEKDIDAELEALRGEISKVYDEVRYYKIEEVKIDKLIQKTLGISERSFLNRQKAESLLLKSILMEMKEGARYGKSVDIKPPTLEEIEKEEEEIKARSVPDVGTLYPGRSSSFDLELSELQIKQIDILGYIAVAGDYDLFKVKYSIPGGSVEGVLRINFVDVDDEISFAEKSNPDANNIIDLFAASEFKDIEIEASGAWYGPNHDLITSDLDNLPNLKSKILNKKSGAAIIPESDVIGILYPGRDAETDYELTQEQINNIEIIRYIGDVDDNYYFYGIKYLIGKIKISGVLRINGKDLSDEIGIIIHKFDKDNNLGETISQSEFYNIEIKGSGYIINDDLITSDLKVLYGLRNKLLEKTPFPSDDYLRRLEGPDTLDILYPETTAIIDIDLTEREIRSILINSLIGRAGNYNFYDVNYTLDSKKKRGVLRINTEDLDDEVSLAGGIGASKSEVSKAVTDSKFRDIDIDGSGIIMDDNLIGRDLRKYPIREKLTFLTT